MITIFSRNLLETAAAITVTSALAGKPKERLFDRDRGPQSEATGAGQWDLKVDLGGLPGPVTAFGVFNANLAVAGIALASSPDDIVYTDRDAYTGVSGTDVLRTFGVQTLQHWRYRVPNFASAPKIGEFFLGKPHVISKSPSYAPGPIDRVVGAVEREETQGAYVRKLRRGEARTGFVWTWNNLEDDWATMLQVFSEIGESAKNFPIIDLDGTVRWVECVNAILEGDRVHPGRRRVVLELLEAL